MARRLIGLPPFPLLAPGPLLILIQLLQDDITWKVDLGLRLEDHADALQELRAILVVVGGDCP
jgi:hypothetical protein